MTWQLLWTDVGHRPAVAVHCEWRISVVLVVFDGPGAGGVSVESGAGRGRQLGFDNVACHHRRVLWLVPRVG